jgi:hypothetical protein
MKKLIGLLAGFALATGLIGAGVGAQFTGQVSAQENINVGTFGCEISTTTEGAQVIKTNTNMDTVWFNVPKLMKSDASSAPLDFTVTSTGDIPVVLQIAEVSVLPSPFNDLFVNPGDQTLNAKGEIHTYHGGIGWPELTNTDLGKVAAVAYVVNCVEKGVQNGTLPKTTVSFSSSGGPGNLNDTWSGTNFIPGATLKLLEYRFGAPTVQDLIPYYAGPVLGDGTFTAVFNGAEDCTPTPEAGPALHVDAPVIVWASDGTRSAIGTGIVLCSKF